MGRNVCEILGVKEKDIFYDNSENSVENVFYKIKNGILYATVDVSLNNWIVCSASTLINLIENGVIVKYYSNKDILAVLKMISNFGYVYVSRENNQISLQVKNTTDTITAIIGYHPFWNSICPIKYKIYRVDDLIAKYEEKCDIN